MLLSQSSSPTSLESPLTLTRDESSLIKPAMKPRRAMYLAVLFVISISAYFLYTAHTRGQGLSDYPENVSDQDKDAAARYVYKMPSRSQNKDKDSLVAGRVANEGLLNARAIQLHPNGVRNSIVKKQYNDDDDEDRSFYRQPPFNNGKAEDFDNYDQSEYYDEKEEWEFPEGDDGDVEEEKKYYDGPTPVNDDDNNYYNRNENDAGGLLNDEDEERSRESQEWPEPPRQQNLARWIKSKPSSGDEHPGFAWPPTRNVHDVVDTQRRAGFNGHLPQLRGVINRQLPRGGHRQPFPNPAGDVHALDDVESFNGEIKGQFKGMILRHEEAMKANSRHETAHLRLAVNGVQARYKQKNANRDAEGSIQEGLADDDTDVSQQLWTLTPEAQAEVSEPEAAADQVVNNNPRPQPFLQGAPFKSHPVRSYEDEESPKRITTGAKQNDKYSLLTRPPQANPRLKIVQRVIRTELITRQEADEHDDVRNDSKAGQSQPGREKVLDTAGMFGLQMENEVAKVIAKSRDPLMEDQFRKVRADLKAIRPGEKPEVKMSEGAGMVGGGVDTGSVLQGKAVPLPATRTPAAGSFAGRVTLYDLSRPVEGKFVCTALRLWVLSRVVCLRPDQGSTDPGQLLARGTWEEEELQQFLAALKAAGEGAGALDIGAGKGVYSLAAASANAPVVAVEPFQPNILTFHKTMQVNQVAELVTLVTDALGPDRGTGRLRPVSGVLGGAFVEPLPLNDLRPAGIDDVVRIVTLDDLAPLVTSKFSRVVIKLDVQGDEYNVLEGARGFFARLDVRFVILRWTPSENRDRYKEMGNFLRQYGLQPASTATGNGLLYSDTDLSRDIKFVVWRKNSVSSGGQ